MLTDYTHHTLRVEELRREAANERMAREVLAARKAARARSGRRFRPPLWRRGRGGPGGRGGGQEPSWVQAA